MAFIPDTPRVRLQPCAVVSREDELREYVASRVATLDKALEDNRACLTSRVNYAEWHRIVRHPGGFYRPATMQQWRDARTENAITALLVNRVTAQPHNRATAQTGIVTLSDGTLLFTRGGRHQSRDAMREGVIQARRLAKRYRRAQLRKDYGGTLTADGLSYGVIHARLQPLDRAIALSDTFIAQAGDDYAIPRLARGLRHEDGTYDGFANLAIARMRHRRAGK